MFTIANTLLNIYRKTVRIHHKNLVYIEGGLGSQILNLLTFWMLQDHLGPEKAKCDLSYFHGSNRNPALWDYQLENYGIKFEYLKKFESKKRTNPLKIKKDFLSKKELDSDFWRNAKKKFGKKFDFDPLQVQCYFNELLNFDVISKFGAVHIRRGDYLTVASKVMNFKDYKDILQSISGILPNKLVITSDSPLSPQERTELLALIGDQIELIYLDQPEIDPFMVHCLLRMANVLITSNSTFSFSAALLAQEAQCAFSPLEFHAGKDSEKYNRTYRSTGNFFLWAG